jgi:hypothetical protein
MTEDKVFHLGTEPSTLRSPCHRFVVRLAAPKYCVNRFEERHAVVVARPRPIQPVDATIFPGDVTVRAGRDVDDDFPVQLLTWLNSTWQFLTPGVIFV